MEQLLPIHGGYNFRELGGYPTLKGKKIKAQRIIRSAALDQLTTADVTFLQNYGVQQVIDFRTTEERLQQPDKIIPQAEYLHLPVFKEDETQSTISPTALFEKILAGESGDARMKKSYQDFVVTPDAQRAYQKFFQQLLTQKGGLLFHCTAGKDRTGFGAYLFLNALEVPSEIIWQDYLKTNDASAQAVQKMLASAKEQGAPEILLTNIEALMVARKEYLTSAITAIHENFGDTANFLKNGLHLAPSDLAQLQAEYLEEA
ncbi:tyrosine-protein phosphatase [Enterococcus nangangensis]|uniref:tyrosine-protein phosphatase n=1 Tax=Enterococcus nangangensis TaxID=2559926 RepID=UPI0010F9777D|nr:tyrosine-protein phosphatase [Enterococcus nangangensis]